jgi:hypothetical protein
MTSTARTYRNTEYGFGGEAECVYVDGVQQPHDWRLIGEEPREVDDERPTFRRRWYCTRCRLVEQWTSR